MYPTKEQIRSAAMALKTAMGIDINISVGGPWNIPSTVTFATPAGVLFSQCLKDAIS
jgi:hypothetical protein